MTGLRKQMEGLRELSDKATPGPWQVARDNYGVNRIWDSELDCDIASCEGDGSIEWQTRKVNADFLAACVNFVRALLAEPVPPKQSSQAVNQLAPSEGNTEAERHGSDLLRSRTDTLRPLSEISGLKFRFHEDSVEIACCLFNKGMLSGQTIDDAAEMIENWMRALAEPVEAGAGQPFRIEIDPKMPPNEIKMIDSAGNVLRINNVAIPCFACGSEAKVSLSFCAECYGKGKRREEPPAGEPRLREHIQAIVNRWDDDKSEYRGRVMIMQLKAALAATREAGKG